MKKRFLALLVACMLLMSPSAMASFLDSPTTTLGEKELIFNVGGNQSLEEDSTGANVITSTTMYDMIGTYYHWMQDPSATELLVELVERGQPLSQLNIKIDNLRELQEEWQSHRQGQYVHTVPITLKGAKASAQFDGHAQNAVRRSALINGTAQLIDYFIRRALASAVGNTYPSASVTIDVAIQSWDELTATDLTAKQQAAIQSFTVLGGARAKISMAVGSANADALSDLQNGAIRIETPITLPVGTSDIVAVRVEDNGQTTTLPAAASGGKASFTTNQLGDYIIIAKPATNPGTNPDPGTNSNPPTEPSLAPVPATGDQTPILLWTVILVLSGAAVLLLIRRKNA